MIDVGVKAHYAAERSAKNAKEEKESAFANLVAEIETRLDDVCPQYSEFSQAISRFVSSHLSAERSTILGVISARRAEGRTTIALGLIAALSEIYGKVLLVETAANPDLGPRSEHTSAKGLYGLSAYLSGRVALEDVILETARPGLCVLPSGMNEAGAASSLATIARTRELFSLLRPKYDVTVVDFPPLLDGDHVPALLGSLDGVVLDTAAGRTRSKDLATVLDLCAGVSVRGILVNEVRLAIPGWIVSLLD